jgi:hypothetical protein
MNKPMSPARALQRNLFFVAKMPRNLRHNATPLGDLVRKMDGEDLIELKAYFDAQSSIVYDELLRRAKEEYGD